MNNSTIQDIGSIKGRMLLFGGVYSNLHSLQKLKKISEELNILPTNIICTGDIIGYCAFPEESVQMVKEWGIHSIAGNVEIQIREDLEDCGCNFSEGSDCDLLSRKWYPFAKTHTSDNSREWMNELPHFIRFNIGNSHAQVVHGSVKDTSEFIFKSTPWENKLDSFHKAETDIIIGGHCGIPFNQKQEGKHWLNPGVIGMPANDGTPRVWYMILEANEDGTPNFSHSSFLYDYVGAAENMETLGLLPEYARTLRSGIWNSCEILPKVETDQQGHALSLEVNS